MNSECTHFHTFFSFFCQWYELEAPEKVAFPLKTYGQLTPIRKLLLLRCFRVDRVFRALQDYVSETMGTIDDVTLFLKKNQLQSVAPTTNCFWENQWKILQ